MNNKNYDVIIVGGSAAGLSAAMTLGRSLRHTLVIDDDKPCNTTALHTHNFLMHDGDTPQTIKAQALAKLKAYPSINFLKSTVTAINKTNGGYLITTETGSSQTCRKIIFANGLTDILPVIKGFEACWGISALHCPYCHGYEFRNAKTGFILDGDDFLGTASIVHNLSKDLIILTNGTTSLSLNQESILAQNNIRIIHTPIEEIIHCAGRVKQILFKGKTSLDFEVLYAHPKRQYNSELAASIGCDLGDHGHLIRNHHHKTNMPGVFACGDVSGSARAISVAVASGNLAGIAVNDELCSESFF